MRRTKGNEIDTVVSGGEGPPRCEAALLRCDSKRAAVWCGRAGRGSGSATHRR